MHAADLRQLDLDYGVSMKYVTKSAIHSWSEWINRAPWYARAWRCAVAAWHCARVAARERAVEGRR